LTARDLLYFFDIPILTELGDGLERPWAERDRLREH
jgi:hypothetical protein